MGQWRQATTGTQRHARIMTSVPVRISTVDAERDPDTGKLFFRSTETTTANLSLGGAYVHSWEPLTAGRRVIVSIDLPDGQEIQVVARVAWTRRELRQAEANKIEEPGYGLEFIGGSRAELAALDAFVGTKPPRPQPAVPAKGAQTAPPVS